MMILYYVLQTKHNIAHIGRKYANTAKTKGLISIG